LNKIISPKIDLEMKNTALTLKLSLITCGLLALSWAQAGRYVLDMTHIIAGDVLNSTYSAPDSVKKETGITSIKITTQLEVLVHGNNKLLASSKIGSWENTAGSIKAPSNFSGASLTPVKNKGFILKRLRDGAERDLFEALKKEIRGRKFILEASPGNQPKNRVYPEIQEQLRNFAADLKALDLIALIKDPQGALVLHETQTIILGYDTDSQGNGPQKFIFLKLDPKLFNDIFKYFDTNF
jgi:hypothetical protein